MANRHVGREVDPEVDAGSADQQADPREEEAEGVAGGRHKTPEAEGASAG